MSGFDQLLYELNKNSEDNTKKGSLFELVMRKYFMVSPIYAEQYEKVWLWKDFPYNGGVHDFGIDLVAKKRDFDEFVAIQCKFYDNNAVSKSDVDSFLTASSKEFYVNGKPFRYSNRIIVSTTDKWTSTAEYTIEGQLPPVTRIRLKDLRDSGIDWDNFSLTDIDGMKKDVKKQERPHQIQAINAVVDGFRDADRGKLIMACGTGKTFASLRIAETLTNGNGSVLFFVPSISLLNQALSEWCEQCRYHFSVFAVCSDPKASRTSDEGYHLTDTILPATTKVNDLTTFYRYCWEKEGMKFFFSTYQSIDVIARFQKETGVIFDLIICDEAHRTTGVTLAGEDESEFVRVHDDDYIHGKKRLYMTATPRIYGDESKQAASQKSALLCSMDDEEIYGREFYNLGFSDAVEKGLLSDYKVVVLAVDEAYVSRTLQNLLTDASSELTLEDSVKIIGCLNGLSKRTVFEGEEDYFANDPTPMKRAVAFAGKIKASKKFVQMTRDIQDELKLYGKDESLISVELDHVDGTNDALFRKDRIDWLKGSTHDNVCRVLSNARCLSEGIDVPALDAVIFLNPVNSIVDIIQSVGRVMRKSDGKKYGYIILPIGIPAGVEPEEALADNKRYKVVWDVLQALRAHDDRFNNTINKIDLNRKKPGNIQIIGVTGTDGETDGTDDNASANQSYQQISFDFDDLAKWKDSIYAKIVKKCGTRRYWETWAKDIANIANRHMEEIRILIQNPEVAERFSEFLAALKQNINQSISENDAIEMLAEHMITRPVFDALFEKYEFTKNNPVSVIMQDMLAILDEKALDKEQETLDKFYASVRERAKGIDNAEGKQKIVIELYEQFFKNALPKQVAKLGIVYTPIEVVDFIINSIERILQEKFSVSMNDKGVHILDPFVGTGTFIVRLLRSGILTPENLLYKYSNEIHANEIVLLAYYIAAINIEETFHDLMGLEQYMPFEGIVMTDTFALSESMAGEGPGTSYSAMFQTNSERAVKEMETPITVIMGNPPYSVGQRNGNDQNQNVKYKNLDASLANTYVKKSKATLSRNVYDTYIKAFRWATDRIGDNGVIGYVSNGAYIDSNSLDGFRQCLLEDFTSVYVLNLRGNQRTSGELSRKEGGKIFGSGSRTPVAITLLVKKKGAKRDKYVHYFDIGDYLTRGQKLEKISGLGNVSAVPWKYLTPSDNQDWINQRNPDFMNFIVLGDKKHPKDLSFFKDNYSSGISTNRDAWVYSFSEDNVLNHANGMVDFYNQELVRCNQEFQNLMDKGIVGSDQKARETFFFKTRSNDKKKISWSSGLNNRFYKCNQLSICDEIRTVAYRPFCKRYLIYNKDIIERPSRWSAIFPDEDSENLVICVSGAPLKKGFSVMISDCMQDLNFLEHSICMPLYFYEKETDQDKGEDYEQLTLDQFMGYSKPKAVYRKRYAISDDILSKFKDMYGSKVDKKQIFYYLYAIMQNNTYIERYSNNLSKEMPRIPFISNFQEYVEIGRKLAELHLHYEDVVDLNEIDGLSVYMKKKDYHVEKMRFAKDKGKVCKDTIVFNENITVRGIPEAAYQYVVNGKSAIEWLMERYAVTKDKDSGIVDDPNLYAGGKYVFNLLLSVISVSVKTIELIDSMPEYKEI